MSTFYTGLESDLSVSRLGKPGGFASLTAAGKLSPDQIPAGLATGLEFQGLWDASTNTPDLTDPSNQSNGNLYVVSVEGTQDLNGTGNVLYTEGDTLFWSDDQSIWYYQQSSVVAEEVKYEGETVASAIQTIENNPVFDYFRVDNASNPGNAGIVIGGGAADVGFRSLAIGRDAVADVSEGIAIGHDALVDGVYGIAIGTSTIGNGFNSVALGRRSEALQTESLALGYDAAANANKAVQIGIGTNTTASTIQYLNTRLANAEGLYTSFTNPTNYTPSDNDNVTSHFQAIDVALGNTIPTQNVTEFNRETITTNRTLANADNVYQHIITNTEDLVVILPTSPINGTHFIIKNSPNSTFTFEVNNVELNIDELYEVKYDGVEWVEL